MNSNDPFGLLGQVLDGQFRIDEVAGEGGSSVVYRGEHVGFDAKVAIKCLKLQAQLEAARIESFMRRFRDEGRAAYKLAQGHFHIARCIAIGTTLAPKSGSLVPYTVLEWLEGQTLARQLEERRLAGGQGRPLADLLPLLDTAVDAVGYAHTQDVVHRDLHPGSIFLAETREGMRAKVLDFGLAKIASEHALGTQESEPSHDDKGGNGAPFRVFSPAYAAPEQLDASLGPVGTWTDVYALAVVLLEAMRDQPPFLGLSLEDLRGRILDPRVRPTPRRLGVTVSDEVEDVFARALACDPGLRIQDAREFWVALKAAAHLGVPVVHRGLADATQRMDALPDSDFLIASAGYDDGPTLNEQLSSSATIRKVLDEETTIDERLGSTLPVGMDYRAAMHAAASELESGRAPAPETSGVQSKVRAEAAAHFEEADVTGPREKTPSADFTGPHRALSADQTAPRKAVSGAELKDKATRGPVVLAVLLGGGAALVLLAVVASFYLQRLQRAGDPVAAASSSPAANPASAPPPSSAPIARSTASHAFAAAGSNSAVAVLPSAPSMPSAPAVAPSPMASASSSASARKKGQPPPKAPAAAGPKAAPTPEEPTELPPPPDPTAFNPQAAQAALKVLDGILASCKRPDGKGGDGSARVTFTNDGTVSAVKVTGPLADGPEGDCVALRYRNAKIPAFEGPPAFVEHAFRIPK